MTTTAFTLNDEKRRFSDEMVSAAILQKEPKPPKNPPRPDACPYCEQALPHPSNSIPSMFRGGVRRLLIALWMITVAIIRCARFAVAGCFCFVGLIGICCRHLGVGIAHPDDRKILTRHSDGRANLRAG